jgi:hypothetical protein
LDSISQVQERNSETALRQQQLKAMQEQSAEEDRAKELMKNAFDSTEYQRVGQTASDTSNQLADKLQSTATQLLGVAPKMGLELLKNAGAARTQASLTDYHTMEAKKYQMSMANDVFAQVNNAQDWEDAKGQLSKLGVVVPPQYNDYGPQTQEWIKNRAIMSAAYQKSIGTDQKVVQNTIRQEHVDIAKKALDEKTAVDNAKEARARAAFGSKPATKTETASNLVELSVDSNFSNLDSPTKIQAANDYRDFIKENIAKGMPPDVARATAKQSVFSNVKAGFGMFSDSTYQGTKPQVSAPALDEFLTKAKAANPGVSEEELKAYYNKKYGK